MLCKLAAVKTAFGSCQADTRQEVPLLCLDLQSPFSLFPSLSLSLLTHICTSLGLPPHPIPSRRWTSLFSLFFFVTHHIITVEIRRLRSRENVVGEPVALLIVQPPALQLPWIHYHSSVRIKRFR